MCTIITQNWQFAYIVRKWASHWAPTNTKPLTHFLHPSTAHLWLNSSGRTHVLYFSQRQNKTSWHISNVQQNNSGATNTRLAESSHVQLHSCKKTNAQTSLFYSWRWCKCWLNAEEQAIRFCISERENFELNVFLPKSLLCGANNTALIHEWNETTWLLNSGAAMAPSTADPRSEPIRWFKSSHEMALMEF